MQLSKNEIKKNFYYYLLFLSFLHAVLRLNETSSFGLYRLLMPISLIMLAFAWKPSKYFSYLFIIVIFYNFIISLLYTNNLFHYSIMTLHYFSIYNIFLITYYLYEKDGFQKLYNFLNNFIYLTLCIAILEIIFNFRLPNTAVYYDGSVSVFNWNQNEYSTILLSFVPLFLVYQKNLFVKLIVMSTIIYIVYINDSKLVLIGIFIALVLYNLKKNILEINVLIKYLMMILLFLLFVMLFFIPYDEIYIIFRDYNISIYELLGVPISHIITLTPFIDNGGSNVTRANAIIYGLLEFKNSNFLGIGMGNTLVMLEKPEYVLRSAKSIHNLPIQLFVEHGFIMLFAYIYMLYIFMKLMIKQNLDSIEMVMYVAIPTILIGSMGSSVGIFSDYYFFVSIFLILLQYTKGSKYEK
jgi:hypothetical protein